MDRLYEIMYHSETREEAEKENMECNRHKLERDLKTYTRLIHNQHMEVKEILTNWHSYHHMEQAVQNAIQLTSQALGELKHANEIRRVLFNHSHCNPQNTYDKRDVAWQPSNSEQQTIQQEEDNFEIPNKIRKLSFM